MGGLWIYTTVRLKWVDDNDDDTGYKLIFIEYLKIVASSHDIVGNSQHCDFRVIRPYTEPLYSFYRHVVIIVATIIAFPCI